MPDETDALLPWVRPVLAGELGVPVVFAPPGFDEGLCALARRNSGFDMKRLTPGGVREILSAATKQQRVFPFATDPGMP